MPEMRYKGCAVCGNMETIGFKLMNDVYYRPSAPLCLGCILYEVPVGVVTVFDARATKALAENAIKVTADHPYGFTAGSLNSIAEKYKVLIISRLHDQADPCLYIKGPMLGVAFATDEIEDVLNIELEIAW